MKIQFVRRELNKIELDTKFIISFASHNNKGEFSYLESFQDSNLNFACLVDEHNSFYLSDDNGASCDEIMLDLIKNYNKKNILLTGSSMGGFAALHYALKHNLNCIVNNPQLNFELSVKNSWADLSQSMSKIDKKNDITFDKYDYNDITSSIYIIHGRHRMDIENMKFLYAQLHHFKKIDIHIKSVDEPNHFYLIKSFDEFLSLADLVMKIRNLNE